jgi:hypothetical protein
MPSDMDVIHFQVSVKLMAKLLDLKNLMDVMKMMADAERLIGEFYRNCAEQWEEDRDFWRAIADEEEKHARNIESMARIIALKPERFEIGRPFNQMGIQTFMNGIADHLKRLQEGLVNRERAMFVALDIEASVLEKCYHELVRTNDAEYLILMNELTKEAGEHRHSIAKRIQKLKDEEGSKVRH